MREFIRHACTRKNEINFTRFLLYFILLTSSVGHAYANLKQGLYFYAHGSPQEQRTTLLLNNKEAYQLKNKDILSLEFDIQIRNKEKNRFGYIFKIISNKNESYNLLLNNHDELFFVFDNPTNKEEFKKISIAQQDKLKIKVTFDKKHHQLMLQINNTNINYKNDLTDIHSLLVNFGECSITGFESNDVPPIILSNVVVKKNDQILNHWLFNKYKNNIIYDRIAQKEAWFNHGKMLIDNSVHWQKMGSIKTQRGPQITFDSLHNQLVILDSTRGISFSIHDGETQYFAMKNIPADLLVNRFVYDYTSHQLLSYNFEPKRLNFYDAKAKSWHTPIEEKHEFAHHNKYISLKDSCLYLYGGYGHYRYKGSLYKVNLKTGQWTENDLSEQITPRYLAAMGGNKHGDKLYILGGKGAEKGLQELSPRIFFDLYEVDLQTAKPKLLYKNEDDHHKNLVFSNSLVVDDQNEYIYTLAYPVDKKETYFQLQKIGIQNATLAHYGDSIPFPFKDDLTYCDLFYSPSLSKLIAVVAYSKDKVNANIEIYSLDFPPLQAIDLYQETVSKAYWWFLLILPTGMLMVYFYSKYHRKNNSYHVAIATDLEHDQLEETIVENSPLAQQHALLTSAIPKFYHPNCNSILFLGDFQIHNKSGQEITELFSPTLKHLLILLIFHTIKNEKGISSTKLEEILWFGKSEKSAINNRNVNISKLRILLEHIDNIEIINKNTYWSIVLPDDLLSDYVETLKLSKQILDQEHFSKDNVQRLLELLSYGELLPSIQTEWIDNFKSEFSNLMVNTLLHVMKSQEQAILDDMDTLLKVTDTIFIFDATNEEAIEVKCKILYQSGKKSLAKSAYENFSKRYFALLDEDYSRTLKEIVE